MKLKALALAIVAIVIGLPASVATYGSALTYAASVAYEAVGFVGETPEERAMAALQIACLLQGGGHIELVIGNYPCPTEPHDYDRTVLYVAGKLIEQGKISHTDGTATTFNAQMEMLRNISITILKLEDDFLSIFQ